MTAPTPAEFGRASKGPTVVEIGGFRGQLIGADHTDRHRPCNLERHH
jgi:hypothetical protein